MMAEVGTQAGLRPYVHHCRRNPRKFIPVLDEACKYIGNIERDFV